MTEEAVLELILEDPQYPIKKIIESQDELKLPLEPSIKKQVIR